MKLTEVFTFVVDRAGRMLRFTLPEDHTLDDLHRAQRLTEELPRIFDVPASQAKTDYIDTTDSPTLKMRATTPASWFEKGDT